MLMDTPPDWAYRAAEEIVFTGTADDDYAASIIAREWQKDTQTIRCVFCGMAYPPGTPASQHESLNAHIRICEKHPLRAAEARITALEKTLKTLRDNPSMWKRGGAGGQDQYAGMPPGMRLIDETLRSS
jgi:hypothetical protein